MTKRSDYQLLCQEFDRILLADEADSAIIANTWLHMLRAHPVFWKNYRHLFQTLTPTKRFALFLLTLMRFASFSVFRVLRSGIFRKPWHVSANVQKSDVLFVSHLTNHNQIGKDDDFYFHDIPKKLTVENITASVALINHIELACGSKLAPWKSNPVRRIVLDVTLTVLDEVRINLTQLRAISSLKELMLKLQTPAVFRKQACLQMISPAAINAARIAKQIRRLIAETQARCVVITYEGHAWERLVLHEARKAAPGIMCIAYQHAPIIKHQHASLRNLGQSYNPDIVLTSGRIAEKQFKHAPAFKNICIKRLGSAKLKGTPSRCNANVNTCLVIPEGLISECILLFEFSLLCASQMPNHNFVWRLHPLVSFTQLEKSSAILAKLPENICLSEETLEYDVQRCDSALYRGSTAVIDAIYGGLRPIYYKLDGEMSIDPIHQLCDAKYIVDCVSDFQDAVKSPLAKQEYTALNQFCENLYTPIDYSAFIEILNR